MWKSDLKLGQLFINQPPKQRQYSQMHKLNNSLRRNTTYSTVSPYNSNKNYQCLFAEAGFSRQDLSLILRYVLLKHAMNPADRNLIRRILLSMFEEDLIVAGTKLFVQFLRLEEGEGRLNLQGKNNFYFVLHGKGTVISQEYQYQIKKGDHFGEIQLLNFTDIEAVNFQSNYLLLKLDQNQFNLFFRQYFIKKYSQQQKQLECIKDLYLNKLPYIPKYLLLRNIQYKEFLLGEKIVENSQRVEVIYFLNQKVLKRNQRTGCLGLFQTLNQMTNYLQTVYCENKKVKLPYLTVDIFRTYVLDIILPSTLQNPSSINQLNKSCLSLNVIQIPSIKPTLNSFMSKKRVKIALPGSRIKTQAQYLQSNFKFLRPEHVKSRIRYNQSQTQKKRIDSSLSKIFNASRLSKRL